MGWPKGKPRAKKPADAAVKPEEVVAALEKEEPKSKGNFVELPIDDITKITVTPRGRVSLTDPQYDPFKKHKVNEDKFYYRALNNRATNMRKREAEGYQVVTDNGKSVEYGDLVLAKLPRDIRNERENHVKERTLRQTKAAVEQFKSEADRAGLKPYEET